MVCVNLMGNNTTAMSSSKSSSKNMYVQTVSDGVMAIYNKLPKLTNDNRDTRIFIKKTSRVRASALERSLASFKNSCKCSQLKEQIESVISDVQGMFSGGETRLYVCHSQHNSLKTELEFVCLAVRMYKVDGDNAVDYCMASYSFQKTVDGGLAAVGISSMGACVGMGLLSLATGGVGGVVLGVVGGSLGLFGATATANAFDTTITGDMKQLLEASFLYELVNRGYAMIGSDRKLYITND